MPHGLHPLVLCCYDNECFSRVVLPVWLLPIVEVFLLKPRLNFMRSFTWTFARRQLSLFVALAAGLWWFTACCQVKSLPTPRNPPQTEVYSMMGESRRPLSFHNPTMSTKKHVVQICRFSLPAAVDGLADSSGERRTTPFKGDKQSENSNERSLHRAVAPQSLAVSAITFPTALSLYIPVFAGTLAKGVR